MSKPIVLGATRHSTKVPKIWQGFKDYFATQGFDFDYMLFDRYGETAAALIDGKVDVTWNSPSSFVAARHYGDPRGLPVYGLALRDTDVDLRSTLATPKSSGIRTLADITGKTIGFDSPFAPESTLLPLEYLERHGLLEGRDFRRVTIDTPPGRSNGYAPDSTLRRIAAMVSGEVDACWLRLDHFDLFQQYDPAGYDCLSVAITEPYDHCIIAAVRGREHPRTGEFTRRLLAMSYEDPAVRPLFNLEGLTKWVPGRDTGFDKLVRACELFGFPEAIAGPCEQSARAWAQAR